MLPFLIVVAALIMTFAMPPSNEKTKLVAIPIGLGIVISIAMLVSLQFRWERGGPFGGMANAMSLLTFLYSLILLWSVITVVMAAIPEWRSRAKYVLPVPIFFGICFCVFFLSA